MELYGFARNGAKRLRDANRRQIVRSDDAADSRPHDELKSGNETVADKGGTRCVKARNRPAEACLAASSLFVGVLGMDAATMIGWGAVALEGAALARATFTSAQALFKNALNVAEVSAGKAVIEASENLMKGAGGVGVSTIKGAPQGVALTYYESGKLSARSIAESFVCSLVRPIGGVERFPHAASPNLNADQIPRV